MPPKWVTEPDSNRIHRTWHLKFSTFSYSNRPFRWTLRTRMEDNRCYGQHRLVQLKRFWYVVRLKLNTHFTRIICYSMKMYFPLFPDAGEGRSTRRKQWQVSQIGCSSFELRWRIFHIYWQIVLFAFGISNRDGLTALHCAASRGHTECISVLINLCGAPTDLIDSNGCTALHYAVTLGHADATYILLDLGADPNRQDRKGRTPAHCGCAKGQFETVRKTIEWFCVRRNTNKFSAPSRRQVKMLRDRKANLWLRNAKGDLPLHEAAASGRRELVLWLLDQRPKHVNTTSNDGRTILHIAASNDYTDMCKVCEFPCEPFSNKFNIHSQSHISKQHISVQLATDAFNGLNSFSHTNWCRLRDPFSLSLSVCDSHRHHPLFHVTNGFVCFFFPFESKSLPHSKWHCTFEHRLWCDKRINSTYARTSSAIWLREKTRFKNRKD